MTMTREGILAKISSCVENGEEKNEDITEKKQRNSKDRKDT